MAYLSFIENVGLIYFLFHIDENKSKISAGFKINSNNNFGMKANISTTIAIIDNRQ